MISEFTQNQFDACQREEGLVCLQQPVVPYQDPALMTQPGEGSLHNESQTIAVRSGMFPKLLLPATRSFIYPFGNARIYPPPFQVLAKSAAVIGSVCQDSPRPTSTSSAAASSNRDLGENAVRDLQFMDVGALQGESERRSVSVDEDRSFCSLANLGDTDATTPFFAEAKLASRIPWDSFSRPLLPSCPNRTRRTRGHTLSRCQRTSRSQQVAGAPYSRGMSCQRQPVFRTNRIPLIVFRSSTLERPRRFLRGNSGWISFQSFADRSVSLMGVSSRREGERTKFKEIRRANLDEF